MHHGLEAFLWGVGSAVSLPLGALLGLWLRPKVKVNSSLMAFGAGALLFALSIELFGHVPDHVEGHGIGAVWAAAIGAVLGGLIFDGLNSLLNNRGAFLRRLSAAKRYVAKLKIKRTEQLVAELSRVKVLAQLPPHLMAELVQRVEQETYSKGEIIYKQGDQAEDMAFIIEGQVQIKLHENGSNTKELALLDNGETFGELGILNDAPRTADAIALVDTRIYKIRKSDFDEIFSQSPELQTALQSLANERLSDISAKSEHFVDKEWRHQTMEHLRHFSVSVSDEEIKNEGHAKAAGGAAVAIWLGLMIDGIPESLVIGMLAISATGMSLAFVAGVFLANLPEAMSSAVSMRSSGMKLTKIYIMWGSITLVTGIGAFIGATAFPSEPTGNLFYIILGIEGLAAGAMLTMIAETMLPEAFEQGGSIVGLSTLGGFLAALFVKVM